jgi:hypothetical protein
MAENILHFAAVRMRVTGSGLLRMKFYNLDETSTQELVPFTMNTAPGLEPTRLANFNSQRARLKVYTNALDESFKINRIILFARQIWSSFPGTS